MSSIFTKIINGEIPAYKVDENEDFLSFLDAMPLVEGHTLVIPKKEVDFLFDLGSEEYQQLWGFAQKVAKKLNLPFVEAIKKIKQNQAQKMMNNAYHQAKNLDGVFEVEDNIPDTPVLLIDDVIDSGWTVTVASALLKQKGSGEVFPASLATTGKM